MSLVTLSSSDSRPLANLKTRWENLGPIQRLILLSVVCFLVALVAWGVYSRKPEMRSLVSGLSAEEASVVVRKLEELKVEYTLTEGGGAIQVPANNLFRVRLELAGAGLLQKGNVGFELFDRVSLNTTDFSERVNYLRALQGELCETIKSIPAVHSVRVHINIPRQAAFLSEAHKATASVLIQLKPGAQLSRPQCQGILNLVASSVEGLTPEAVTLTDTGGSFMFSGKEELMNSGSSEEDQVSRQLQRTAQGVLDGVLGSGRGLASVRVEFQRDRKQSQREIFEPGPGGKPLEKSRKQTEESYQGGGRPGLPGGIPTPNQSAPGASPTPANATTANTTGANATSANISGVGDRPRYNQTSQQVEYQISRRTESVEEAPNKIRRLTASVLVDSQAKLDKAALDSLTQAVSMALGIDPQRGDKFNLRVIPFNRETEEQDKAALEQLTRQKEADKKQSLMIAGAALAGLLPLTGLVWLLARRRKPAALEEAALSAAEAAKGGRVDVTLPALDSQGTPVAALPAPPADRALLISKALKAAKENPALVARVLQTWLDADREKR